MVLCNSFKAKIRTTVMRRSYGIRFMKPWLLKSPVESSPEKLHNHSFGQVLWDLVSTVASKTLITEYSYEIQSTKIPQPNKKKKKKK